VQRFSFKCLIFGHDDDLRRTPSRLYLQCADCGRETDGWEIADRAHPRAEHRSGNRDQLASTSFAMQVQLFFSRGHRKAAESLERAVKRALDALYASRS
jgi:hypothetical protein